MTYSCKDGWAKWFLLCFQPLIRTRLTHWQIQTSHDISSQTSGPGAEPMESYEELKVRVVTPTLARAEKDFRSIPLLPGHTITTNTTLRELKTNIAKYLGVSTANDLHEYDDLECNCSFARHIDERGGLNQPDVETLQAMTSLIVVHGKNKVTCLQTPNNSKALLLDQVRIQLPRQTFGKKVLVIGGVEAPDSMQVPFLC